MVSVFIFNLHLGRSYSFIRIWRGGTKSCENEILHEIASTWLSVGRLHLLLILSFNNNKWLMKRPAAFTCRYWILIYVCLDVFPLPKSVFSYQLYELLWSGRHHTFSFQILTQSQWLLFCIQSGCCSTCKSIYSDDNEEKFLYQLTHSCRVSAGGGHFSFLYYVR